MPARQPRSTLTIGAVLAALQPDFPDVTISKIRFLEAEGLVTPARTGSGYRSYSEADVERLRYVLGAQRDHFWPLKVIREALDAMDRGLTPSGGPAGTLTRPSVPPPREDPDVPSTGELRRRSALRLTRAELAEAAALDEETLGALETFGLVRADAAGHYGEGSLGVARAAAALAAYGIEPRHLRSFRTAADREIGLVQQAVGPHRGADPTADVLHWCIALHAALVKDGLQRDG